MTYRSTKQYKHFYSPDGKVYRMNIETGDVEQLITTDDGAILWAMLDGDGMTQADCYGD